MIVPADIALTEENRERLIEFYMDDGMTREDATAYTAIVLGDYVQLPGRYRIID